MGSGRHVGSSVGQTSRMTLWRAVLSECVRLKRSPLIALHLACGLIAGVACGAYFGVAPWDPRLGTDAFVQLIGALMPLMVAIVCGLDVDGEREASGLANLLAVPSRRIALAARVLVLWLLGIIAMAVALGSFAGTRVVRRRDRCLRARRVLGGRLRPRCRGHGGGVATPALPWAWRRGRSSSTSCRLLARRSGSRSPSAGTPPSASARRARLRPLCRGRSCARARHRRAHRGFVGRARLRAVRLGGAVGVAPRRTWTGRGCWFARGDLAARGDLCAHPSGHGGRPRRPARLGRLLRRGEKGRMSTRLEFRPRIWSEIVLALVDALVAVPALSGCRGLSHPEEFPTSGSSASPVEATSNPQTITREEFGDQWPFEFDRCEVSAEPDASGDPVLRLTTGDGAVYALNGLPDNDVFPKAEDLVRPGASIGPIRSFALSLADLE